MIKFIDKDGYTFFGEAPYIHWFGNTEDNGQSTYLQYIKNLLIISDSAQLKFSVSSTDSVFKLINSNLLTQETQYELKDIQTDSFTLTGIKYENSTDPGSTGSSSSESQSNDLFLYQLIVSASSDEPGQITEDVLITTPTNQTTTIKVGADFYDYDEILNINLGNRGTEIPETIQKAIYGVDIQEAYVDYTLINRKFKELISNYLDIVDNKGSYKSLVNSLKWFEWGEGTILYEVWKRDEKYFEKELENILSEQYKSLLYTHQKTSYVSIESALMKYSTDSDGKVQLDEEKLPILERISSMWSDEILGLKISLLGAFFERYFMPIHLSLLHASVQTRVFASKTVKVKSGHLVNRCDWHDDWGVVDIDMDHTVVLGDVKTPVSVGWNTVFGDMRDINNYDDVIDAGVDILSDVEARSFNNDSIDNGELKTIWSHIKGHVGVVVPITVTVPLPEGDGISNETLVIYRYQNNISECSEPIRIFERRYWKSVNIGTAESPVFAARFTFNLLSTKEEKVSFTLQLHSLSGHTWTAASTYETVDTSGAKLNAYRVNNKVFSGVFEGDDPWINSLYSFDGMYNSINNSDYTKSILTQYIPTGNNMKYLNKLFVIDITESPSPSTEELEGYYVISRNPENKQYIMCLRKEGGATTDSFSEYPVVREDYVFIPQLHEYINIESIPLKKDKTGKYIMSYNDYLVDPNEDLICVIPEFKYSKQVTDINWKFENKTTHEIITIDQPTPTPLVARNNLQKILSDGYWSATVYFRFTDSTTINHITRNSMFLIKKKEDD